MAQFSIPDRAPPVYKYSQPGYEQRKGLEKLVSSFLYLNIDRLLRFCIFTYAEASFGTPWAAEG